MFCQIVEKEFPFGNFPEIRHFVIVEANHESRNEIEFLSKIRERAKSVDSLNYTADSEQPRNFPKHRQTVHIKAESRMPQQLGYVEKISCPAAKIEDALGTHQIEFNLPNSTNVDSNPAIKIKILRPVCAGIGDGISLANLLESHRIDCLDDPLLIKRKSSSPEKSERVFPRADQALAIYKLAYFVSKSHLKIDHSL